MPFIVTTETETLTLDTPIFDRFKNESVFKDERDEFQTRNLFTEEDGIFWMPCYKDGLYASECGQIKQKGLNFSNKYKVKSQHLNHNKLVVSGRSKKNHLVDRLVLEAFTGSHDDMHVHHINGDYSDNRLENLEWSDKKQRLRK